LEVCRQFGGVTSARFAAFWGLVSVLGEHRFESGPRLAGMDANGIPMTGPERAPSLAAIDPVVAVPTLVASLQLESALPRCLTGSRELGGSPVTKGESRWES